MSLYIQKYNINTIYIYVKMGSEFIDFFKLSVIHYSAMKLYIFVAQNIEHEGNK